MLKEKTLFRGELALPFAVLINSFGVVLMLYSAAGIPQSQASRMRFLRCSRRSHSEPGRTSFRDCLSCR